VAAVITQVQAKQIRINTHKRNNTKNTAQIIQNTANKSTHINKTLAHYNCSVFIPRTIHEFLISRSKNSWGQFMPRGKVGNIGNKHVCSYASVVCLQKAMNLCHSERGNSVVSLSISRRSVVAAAKIRSQAVSYRHRFIYEYFCFLNSATFHQLSIIILS
jgi:hypothetical protein